MHREPCREYFSRNLLSGSRRSADVIVPLVLRLIQPRSVIDVGCGTGSWLAAFRSLGVSDVLGVDGGWADTKMLEIPEELFKVSDLKRPLRPGRQFDLVLSLEVAQHLPGQYAQSFVKSLTRLGPVVLFSAAIPFQEGIGHVNEQWPDYWANLFADQGYVAIDAIRKHVWQNDNVEWWFVQNMLFFAARRYVERHLALRKELESTNLAQLALVHPRKHLQMAESLTQRQQVAESREEIASFVPPGETWILVDEGQLADVAPLGRLAQPFLEREGEYWGRPADDAEAIRELERLRVGGARFLVFAWPAFWWLDYYTQFHGRLRAFFPCVLENDRLIVFDLRPAAEKCTRRASRKARRSKRQLGGATTG